MGQVWYVGLHKIYNVREQLELLDIDVMQHLSYSLFISRSGFISSSLNMVLWKIILGHLIWPF